MSIMSITSWPDKTFCVNVLKVVDEGVHVDFFFFLNLAQVPGSNTLGGWEPILLCVCVCARVCVCVCICVCVCVWVSECAYVCVF